jgi:hypothetical protein
MRGLHESKHLHLLSMAQGQRSYPYPDNFFLPLGILATQYKIKAAATLKATYAHMMPKFLHLVS